MISWPQVVKSGVETIFWACRADWRSFVLAPVAEAREGEVMPKGDSPAPAPVWGDPGRGQREGWPEVLTEFDCEMVSAGSDTANER